VRDWSVGSLGDGDYLEKSSARRESLGDGRMRAASWLMLLPKTVGYCSDTLLVVVL